MDRMRISPAECEPRVASWVLPIGSGRFLVPPVALVSFDDAIYVGADRGVWSAVEAARRASRRRAGSNDY